MTGFIGAIICALLILGACASSSDIAGERRNVGNVTMTFTATPARARAGQAVRLTLRLVNNAGRQLSLTFPTSQKYDFWITSGSREVWRWSADRVFSQDVIRQDIAGQTVAVFSETWNAAQMGNLVAHARLTAESYDGEMKGALTVR
jgi:hypothetical protein